jgi:hypothetical protein
VEGPPCAGLAAEERIAWYDTSESASFHLVLKQDSSWCDDQRRAFSSGERLVPTDDPA